MLHEGGKRKSRKRLPLQQQLNSKIKSETKNINELKSPTMRNSFSRKKNMERLRRGS